MVYGACFGSKRKIMLTDAQKLYHREYYAKHKARRAAILREQKRSLKQKRAKFLADLKNVPCKDCGCSYPSYVMDFDHKENKQFTIAKAKHDVSLPTLLVEIAKCDVICANCHRIRTHSRGVGKRSAARFGSEISS